MSAGHLEVHHALPERADTAARVAGDLFSLTKPRLSALVLFTTAGGYALAPGEAPLWPMLRVIFATALLVASANTLNCWYERATDARMFRTRTRPLPAGRLPAWVALVQGLFFAGIALPMLALYGNPLAATLGALAHASYVAIYTPMKRHSSLATVVGALPGALPPLIGWVAATGSVALPGAILFGVLFLWQIPHFLALSVLLEEDYARAGLKVLPHESPSARWNVVLWTLALVPVSLLLVPIGAAGRSFGASALVAGIAFLAAGVAPGTDKRKWARRLFLASILYLSVLFAMLAVDGGA